MPVTTNAFYGRLIETFSKRFNCISALVYHVFLKTKLPIPDYIFSLLRYW